MPITLKIPDDISALAAEQADKRGMSPEEIMMETLRIHLRSYPPELQDEIDIWERASDEDFEKFIKEYETD